MALINQFELALCSNGFIIICLFLRALSLAFWHATESLLEYSENGQDKSLNPKVFLGPWTILLVGGQNVEERYRRKLSL